MKSLFFGPVALLVATPAIYGCDLCAVYSATHAQGLSATRWSASAAVQFTHFGTLRLDGDRVPNAAEQSLDSTITQFVISHGFTDRLSLQVNIPYIYRSFQRPEGLEIDQGHESGLGDISLLGRYELIRRDAAKFTVLWDILGGIKFATGSSSRIGEELLESSEPEGAIPSGVHGHDLTLGTGSTDGLVGTSVYVRSARFFATASLQYSLRQRGGFDYRFANDLTWEAAPGAYLLLGHEHTLGAQLVISGERKANDDLAGEATDDTGITAVYVGPRLTYTWGMALSAGLGVDIPVTVKNTALQLTADYRVRGSLTWTF